MNCTRFADIVAAYVDGQLAGPEVAAAQTHLDTCPRCRELADECRAVRDLVRDRKALVPLPEGLWPRTLARIDVMIRGRLLARRLAFFGVGLVAAVALATVTYHPIREVFARPIIISDTGVVRSTVVPVASVTTSNTSHAFALVRSHLGTDVPPVNLKVVGGRLSCVDLYEKPSAGVLTYRLRSGEVLRYYISKSPFRLSETPEVWTIEGTDVQAVQAPTHFAATWEARGLSYAVLSDRVPPDPKSVIRQFIESLEP